VWGGGVGGGGSKQPGRRTSMSFESSRLMCAHAADHALRPVSNAHLPLAKKLFASEIKRWERKSVNRFQSWNEFSQKYHADNVRRDV